MRAGGICPRGSDQTAQKGTTVATQFVRAPDDSADGNVDGSHFESHKFQDPYNEADVGFSFSSAGKTSQQSNCLEFDAGYQVMLPGPCGQITRTCAKDSKSGKVGGKPESVLVARFGNGKHGWGTVVQKVQSDKVACRKQRQTLRQTSTKTQRRRRERKHADSNTRQNHAT